MSCCWCSGERHTYCRSTRPDGCRSWLKGVRVSAAGSVSNTSPIMPCTCLLFQPPKLIPDTKLLGCICAAAAGICVPLTPSACLTCVTWPCALLSSVPRRQRRCCASTWLWHLVPLMLIWSGRCRHRCSSGCSWAGQRVGSEGMGQFYKGIWLITGCGSCMLW